MEVIKQLLPILLTVSLGLMVVAAGMASSRGDFTYVLSRPALLGRAFLAIIVIPFIAAIVITSAFSVSPATKAGILLMAISPVPPLVPGKALKFGGKAAYAYGIQAAAAVMAIVTVPLLGSLTAATYGIDAEFPVSVVASNVFMGLIVPLAIGLALGRWLFPNAAPKVPRLISIVSNVLLLLVVIPILVAAWPQMRTLMGDGSALAMALVIIIALIGGHMLGGASIADRSTLAFSAAMRHPGIALALAGANHSNKAVSAAVLLFLIVGLIVLLPYQIFLRRKYPEAPDQA